MKDLIIPDVHGRVFWKDILPLLSDKQYNKFIFLGDYLDPYPDEGFSRNDSIKGLLDIIDLKTRYKDKIVLLLGNHDLGYLHSKINTCRRDYSKENIIRAIFTEFKSLFNLLYERPITNNQEFDRVLYSHAGFTKGFLDFLKKYLPEVNEDNLTAVINNYWHQDANTKEYCSLINLLSVVSFFRGGIEDFGSFVWADCREHCWREATIDKTIQIFGHSQQSSSPLITKYCACLDVRQVFSFDYDTLEFRTLHEKAS